MGDFLTSGRRTRFAPSKEIERQTIRRGDAAPQRDPTVARGLAEAAAKLLADPAFGHVVDALADQIHEQFAGSGPGTHGTATRELLYTELKAIETIVQRLGTMQDDFDIYSQREAENPPSDD